MFRAFRAYHTCIIYTNPYSKAMRKHKKNRKRPEKSNGADTRKPYEEIVRENKDFEAYYKLQKVCEEDEWDEFLTAMKSDLPTAFRITNFKSEAKALLTIVQGQYFKDFLNARKEVGDDVLEPTALPWYPDSLAWQLQLTRKDIRRSEVFFRLHNFLISETESGNISRQEVVSMIPPIALDIKSHHKILDMCAAPGSKTAQLIEYLHNGEERLPEGFVIANDIDNNRCYMLVHQAKRLNSPNIIITNHDSAIMPNFTVTKSDGTDGVLKFDRILCDVPCTGDGTLRKNPDIWTKWNTANGNNLHGVQFRIVKRGCEMLNVGGRLVYSTCSLNPVENEAVIIRLLTEAKGSLELVDLTDLLPGLKWKKGLKSWTPASRDLQSYKSFEDVPEKWHTVLRPQMFPPPEEVLDEHHIDRCIRILPHHQDTGAFFVAALQKVKLLPWEASHSRTAASEPEEKPPVIIEPARKKRRIFGYKEDPYVFFDKDEPIWAQIKEFYEITDDLQGNCLLTRCKEGKKKNIYLTSPHVRDIVLRNSSKFKIINTGVKTFARCDNKEMKCSFRLAQEGLWSIYPFIGSKRKVKVTKDDLMLLLSHDDAKFPPETTKLDPETQKTIATLGQGSCVLVYREEPVSESALHLEMVGWIGAMSTRAYVPLSDCIHFLRLLGGDTSKFDVNKFKKGIKEGPEEVATDVLENEVDLENGTVVKKDVSS